MKQVAKLVLVNAEDKYLLLYRDDHPSYGNDADLPGGTLEDNEDPVAGVCREVMEETGLKIDASLISFVHSDNKHSAEGTVYLLYSTKIHKAPVIKLSWEHVSYEWLNKNEFLEKARSAQDTYMHMVYEALNNT